MMNSNYPYGIFNPIYLKQNDVHMEQNCQWEQNKNIANMVKALSDFIDVAEKVKPEERQQAFDACMSAICMHMVNKNGGNS